MFGKVDNYILQWPIGPKSNRSLANYTFVNKPNQS